MQKRLAIELRTPGEIPRQPERPGAPGRLDPPARRLAQAVHLLEPQPHARAATAPGFRCRSRSPPPPVSSAACQPLAFTSTGSTVTPCALRIAHELRRRVKPHRLAAEQGRREGRRMMALEPCRHVDEQREARRVRLRKAVFAEAADLAEHLLGELLRQPAGEHAVDEPSVKLVDHARPPPGPHRAAQLIGLARREARRHHRQPHRLLLEERHAERLLEHLADRVVGIGHRLLARPPAQVGMHHVALDRPRPHDRHLDHEVVEAGAA